MAYAPELEKVQFRLKLDNGTTEGGAQKLLRVSIGSINEQTYDMQKAINIGLLLQEVMDNNTIGFEEVKTSNVEDQ